MGTYSADLYTAEVDRILATVAQELSAPHIQLSNNILSTMELHLLKAHINKSIISISSLIYCGHVHVRTSKQYVSSCSDGGEVKYVSHASV